MLRVGFVVLATGAGGTRMNLNYAQELKRRVLNTTREKARLFQLGSARITKRRKQSMPISVVGLKLNGDGVYKTIWPCWKVRAAFARYARNHLRKSDD